MNRAFLTNVKGATFMILERSIYISTKTSAGWTVKISRSDQRSECSCFAQRINLGIASLGLRSNSNITRTDQL